MKNLLNNWKTTAAGLTMIVGAVVHLIFAIRAKQADENTWTISIGAVIGGAGLIFAGDAGTSIQKTDVQSDSKTGYLKKVDP